MAQAARLNLRMQKEISLLLSDPPHGASFPNLSSSLSSIDAQIEGPEGTVYARGIFRISIQIPDRYPFQPPIVTFATPIYHPNIDNGGRICLDILNLPPKGAWQPSLNISTVLISIGLLLSEPNPDDGLMCEASREYKYNRQAFDQKARVMTEKYAKSGCTGSGGSILGIQNTSDNFVQSQDEETEGKPNCDDFKSFASSSKPRGIHRRLSLAPSESTSKIDDDNPAKDMTVSVMRNNMNTGGTEHQLKFSQDDFHLSHSKLSMSRRKLSLDSLGQFKKGNCEFNEQEVSGFGKQTHMSHDGKLANRNAEAASCSSDQVDDAMREHPRVSLSCSEHDFADKIRSILIDTKLKRFPVNRKVLEPSSGSNETLEKDTNVNIRPSCKSTILQSQNSTKSCSLSSTTPRAGDHASDFSQGNCDLSPNHKKCKFDAVATLEPAKKSDKHESIALETVIVLDSDNSDDERKQKKPKLKLSLSTRRLVSKGKAKA